MRSNPASRHPNAGRLIADAVGFIPALSSEERGWRSASLYMWRGVSQECLFPVLDQPVLVYHTGGAASVPCRAHGVGSATSHPGLLTLVPPGTPVTWDICGEVHSYSVHLAPNAFERLLDRECGTALAALRFRGSFLDALLGGLVTAMAAEMMQPRELGSLYIDALTDSMALHLLRGAADMREATASLPQPVLRRILELIESSLESGISLQVLAREAGLSRAWFSSAFRHATGISPHRYLTQRRIEAARQHLAATAKPISEIAIECGFSSQAHFTEAFRRATGATPAAFRRRRN